MKPNMNSVEVHPQLSNNGHPVDGAMVGAGWFTVANNCLVTYNKTLDNTLHLASHGCQDFFIFSNSSSLSTGEDPPALLSIKWGVS